MTNEFRVITTDLKLVKLIPVAREVDSLGLICAGICKNGILYVWGDLKEFLPNSQSIIFPCFDSNITDEQLLEMSALSSFKETIVSLEELTS